MSSVRLWRKQHLRSASQCDRSFKTVVIRDPSKKTCLFIVMLMLLYTVPCRHTELFRSCNSKSDYGAKSHMQEWTKGFIQMPNIAVIPIKDIKKCLPDTWKVCGTNSHSSPCYVDKLILTHRNLNLKLT